MRTNQDLLEKVCLGESPRPGDELNCRGHPPALCSQYTTKARDPYLGGSHRKGVVPTAVRTRRRVCPLGQVSEPLGCLQEQERLPVTPALDFLLLIWDPELSCSSWGNLRQAAHGRPSGPFGWVSLFSHPRPP